MYPLDRRALLWAVQQLFGGAYRQPGDPVGFGMRPPLFPRGIRPRPEIGIPTPVKEPLYPDRGGVFPGYPEMGIPTPVVREPYPERGGVLEPEPTYGVPTPVYPPGIRPRG